MRGRVQMDRARVMEKRAGVIHLEWHNDEERAVNLSYFGILNFSFSNIFYIVCAYIFWLL
jgi:hypothetical protein